ncbi:MAG: hypothetical protein HQL31_12455 [Planctomycetes bacterium]|nr:hypothetical protein [Planctomycetota bacterium]
MISSPATDAHADLTRRIQNLELQGGGTLNLDDGIYGLGKTLRLPRRVSLCMSPHAILRAMPGFAGDAVLLKTSGEEKNTHERSGIIRGGIIDGGRLQVTGLRIEGCARLEVTELEVLNALHKGIHANGWYEVNIHNIRCNVDLDIRCAPGSIGLHYENADSIANTVMIVGYETGVRSDGGSSDFSGIHVWNYDPAQGPMKTCFYCNGEGDTYVQCYADSPSETGFHVCKPFQRILACRTFYSRFQEERAGTGVYITQEGDRGSYIGNFYYAVAERTFAKAYDGHLENATIIGDVSTLGVVHGGKACRIPSQRGGLNESPPLHVTGNSMRLNPSQSPPGPDDGTIGDIVWSDEHGREAINVKTSRGWLQALLNPPGK